jgi:ElaB/YqjD/DUF883 family membrane-anchored ribosome-binding protein
MGSEAVDRYAAEADDARARMTATLDEIQERLDPRRIASEAFEKLTGGGLQLAGQARDAAKAHPLAIGAAAAAVGLALLARRGLSRARLDLGDSLGAYSDYEDGYGYAESRLLRDEDVPKSRPSAPKRRVDEAVDANPVMSIIVGLAAGALLGLVFPAVSDDDAPNA